MTNAITTIICVEYTRLMCAARRISDIGGNSYEAADALTSAAMLLYDRAPSETLSDLDSIKRTLEIDPDTTDVNSILMRAAVLTI
jgi:hypothetical protein